jgi:hypothetical protein
MERKDRDNKVRKPESAECRETERECTETERVPRQRGKE